MTKQGMAEWLAEKVLGWEARSDSPAGYLQHKLTGKLQPLQYFKPFIYSPDGFFAVWDKCLEEGFQSIEIEVLNVEPDGQETWDCRLYDHEATGKDRYEAFYNAVYQAMK